MNNIDVEMQLSYSYVNKKFHCFSCNREFKLLVKSDEGATCISCESEFVEEVTRETSDEIQHFSPYVARSQEPQQVHREQESPRSTPVMTYVTETIARDGSVFIRRVTTENQRTNRTNVRQQPLGFFDSIFGIPMMGMGMPRAFNLNDIIELSMRDAGNQGLPPASDESIANLEKIDVKPSEHQCPI